MSEPMLSWSQPICDACWRKRHPEGRIANRIVERERETEQCVDCGAVTRSGIYVRVDPAEAKYPSRVKD